MRWLSPISFHAIISYQLNHQNQARSSVDNPLRNPNIDGHFTPHSCFVFTVDATETNHYTPLKSDSSRSSSHAKRKSNHHSTMPTHSPCPTSFETVWPATNSLSLHTYHTSTLLSRSLACSLALLSLSFRHAAKRDHFRDQRSSCFDRRTSTIITGSEAFK